MSDNQKPEMQNAAENAGQNASSHSQNQNQEQCRYGAQGAAPHPYPPQQPPYGYAEPPQQNMGGYQHGQHGQQGQHGNWHGQGGQGGHSHHAPVYPYQAQNQPMPPPVAPPPPQYHNPYYDPYMGQYSGAHYNNQPPAPESGLSSFLNFRDERFLKGALVGAAVTFLLTNDSVQKNAISTIAKVWNLFQGGFEEVKERFRDAEAEIKAQEK